jgi:hypothetical protein
MKWYKLSEKQPLISREWFGDKHQNILIRIKD